MENRHLFVIGAYKENKSTGEKQRKPGAALLFVGYFYVRIRLYPGCFPFGQMRVQRTHNKEYRSTNALQAIATERLLLLKRTPEILEIGFHAAVFSYKLLIMWVKWAHLSTKRGQNTTK